VLIHPDIARKLAGMLETPRADTGKSVTITGLTQAEGQIVRLIADGQSNKEIAASMFLSEGTVKNYISEILNKLELRDRTQIAIFYLKLLHR
jgi:DNA-binding NarL/FixJ family response regulator